MRSGQKSHHPRLHHHRPGRKSAAPGRLRSRRSRRRALRRGGALRASCESRLPQRRAARRAFAAAGAGAGRAAAASPRIARRVRERVLRPNSPLCALVVRWRPHLQAAAGSQPGNGTPVPDQSAHRRDSARHDHDPGAGARGRDRIHRRERGELVFDRGDGQRHHASAHTHGDRSRVDSRDRGLADSVPRSQPIASKHVSVRYGQAGDRHRRVQPAATRRRVASERDGVPHDADGSLARAGPSPFLAAPCRAERHGRRDELFRIRYRGRGRAQSRVDRSRLWPRGDQQEAGLLAQEIPQRKQRSHQRSAAQRGSEKHRRPHVEPALRAVQSARQRRNRGERRSDPPRRHYGEQARADGHGKLRSGPRSAPRSAREVQRKRRLCGQSTDHHDRQRVLRD